ncbi:hypothetical protein ACIFOT_16445 [Neobacillus sp. NRS-1170]
MIKIPAEKLAAAVNKHLLPGLLRSISGEQKTSLQNNEDIKKQA